MKTEQERYLEEGGGTVIPEPFTVELTCGACPEQWEIFIDGEQVGYLRCRWSWWQLDYPTCMAEPLIAEQWHPERGLYESNFDEERPAIFDRVFRALTARILEEKKRAS